MRIIEADLDVHGADGTRIGDSYRLITTLTDWRRYPAGELIRLYHERWEIEVTYLALRHTLLGGYVLRSRDRAGAEQELWALLTVYQLIRMAMTAAAEAAGTDPDRASFTAALEAAREQVITARGIEDPGDPGDTGRIGRAVLAGLLPARRARYSARKVKCSTSRYHVRDQERGQPSWPPGSPGCRSPSSPRPRTGPPPAPAAAKDQPPGPGQPRPDTRRDQVTRIMTSQPGRDWAGRDLAALLGIAPRNMLTQLAEWTRLGFLAKTGPGRYALPGPPPAPAAPADPQQDPAPAGIIAVTTEVTGEAAATHAPSLLPPSASFPTPAGTPLHRRQAAGTKPSPVRRNGHGEHETAYSQQS